MLLSYARTHYSTFYTNCQYKKIKNIKSASQNLTVQLTLLVVRETGKRGENS